MGHPDSNLDYGWLPGCAIPGNGNPCCSFVRLSDKALSDVSRRQELATNTIYDKESVWCRQELVQSQSVWIELQSWKANTRAEQFGLDECTFRIMGWAGPRKEVRG
jgi:hypothetical protein